MSCQVNNGLFIHIYKTGGNSVRQAFKVPRGSDILGVHSNVEQTIETIGLEKYDSLYSFAFVRHPYTWCASLYHYIKRERNHEHNRRVLNMNFTEFLNFLGNHLLPMQYPHGANRHQTLTDFLTYEGKLRVSFIGKFENFGNDLKIIAESIGSPINKIPHANSNNKNYNFNQEQKDLIYKFFEKDFSTFEYTR